EWSDEWWTWRFPPLIPLLRPADFICGKDNWLCLSVGRLCVESALCHAHGVLGTTRCPRGNAVNMDIDVVSRTTHVEASSARFVLGTGARRLHQTHVFDDVARVFHDAGAGGVAVRWDRHIREVVAGAGQAGVGDAGGQPCVVAGTELRD